VFVRILSTAFLVSALAAVPVAAQAQQGGGKTSTTTTTTSGPVVTSDEIVLEGDSTPRPALPTINGDTGLWFVPTAEVMPKGKWSASVFRANYDRRQGLTDVNQIGFTGAIGIADRSELFGTMPATFDGAGVNFAIFSEHGTKVELCLFDSADESAVTT